MATNYDLKLVVDADTTEARRKLDELADVHSSPEVKEAAQIVRDAKIQAAEKSEATEKILNFATDNLALPEIHVEEKLADEIEKRKDF